MSRADLLPSYTSNGAQRLSALCGLCLWILGEEQVNNLAECRDALCKDRYQVWNTKRQLPERKGQRSSLFKWRCSIRKTGLLNLIHLSGEKGKAGTDAFFFPFIHVALLQSRWWNGNPVLTQLPSILRQIKVQPPAITRMNCSCGYEVPSVMKESCLVATSSVPSSLSPCSLDMHAKSSQNLQTLLGCVPRKLHLANAWWAVDPKKSPPLMVCQQSFVSSPENSNPSCLQAFFRGLSRPNEDQNQI